MSCTRFNKSYNISWNSCHTQNGQIHQCVFVCCWDTGSTGRVGLWWSVERCWQTNCQVLRWRPPRVFFPFPAPFSCRSTVQRCPVAWQFLCWRSTRSSNTDGHSISL